MRIYRDVTTRAMAKRGVAFAAAVAVLVCGVVPAYAWWRGPVWVGPYLGYPYYTPPVVVEPSPPVVVQPSPPVVVQPPAPQVYAQPDDRAGHDYYYCESVKAYYPYVKECPQGWTRVAPQPMSGAPK